MDTEGIDTEDIDQEDDMGGRHRRRTLPRDAREHARPSPAQPPRGPVPVAAPAPAAPALLVVAVCTGHRCAGLRELADPGSDGGGGELRAAVRERPRAVLMTTGCQGRCHLAPVATVGDAVPPPAGRSTGAPGALTWAAPPVALGPLDRQADRALARWVRTTAPLVADLPPVLRRALPPGHRTSGVARIPGAGTTG